MKYILTVDPVKHEEQRARWRAVTEGATCVGGTLNLDDLLKACYELQRLRKSQPEVDQVVHFKTEEDRARFIAWANLNVKEVPSQSLILEGTPLPSIRPGKETSL